MIIIGFFPGIDSYALPLVDATLLTILVFPFLHLLFFRPLMLFAADCKRQDMELDELISQVKESADE